MKRKAFSLLAALLITAQAAWADETVTNESELRLAVQTNQTVTLGQDITLNNSHLAIKGTTVTIDLNGHTLSRSMLSAESGGHVICIMEDEYTKGALTITDSGSGGTITGGWDYEGGGIYLSTGCSLTINGGTISGNRASKNGDGQLGDGGGICNEGTLIMTGGTISGNEAEDGGGICNEGTAQIAGVTISGNTASGNGGGIDISGTANGSMILTDVTITDNTAQANGGGISLWKPEKQNCTVELKGTCTITDNTAGLSGGGIYHHGFGTYRPGPTLTVQDKPIVQDNAPTDVHLGSAQLITFSAAFTTGARIGVYCANEQQTVFTSGYKNCNGDTAPAKYFFVSSPTVSGNVVWSGDEAAIQATGYKYVERGWDGIKVTETTKVCEKYIVLSGSHPDEWIPLEDNKWYVVTDNAEYKTLNVTGTDVHLILCNGTQLTVTGGVKLEGDHQLSIYSQPKSISVEGKLIANNEEYHDAACIGSGTKGTAAGALVVHGGTIEANGIMSGPAAIGGASESGFSPTGGLTVYGGTITATAQFEGAGIGSGSDCNTSAGNVTIYGGTVIATGGGNNESPYDSGAGIGGGDGSPGAIVNIHGGTVIATGGGGSSNQMAAGIGAGYGGTATNTLTLYDNAMVKAGTYEGGAVAITAGERVSACQSQKYVLIEPCTHSGSAFTIDDGHTHHTTCTYCLVGANSQPESHVFGSNGQCLCGLVALSDMANNAGVLSAWNGTTVPVTLSGRTLYKDGRWNTLCLPFAVALDGSPLEGATVKSLSKTAFADGTLTLNFSDDLTAIEAGKPYIVKWASTQATDNLVSPVFRDVTISNNTTEVKTDEVTFSGLFSPYAISGEDRSLLYLGAGNQLYWPNAAMTIGACRALFRLQGGITAGEPKEQGGSQSDNIRAFVLNFFDEQSGGAERGDGEQTGIAEAVANSSVFTLHSSLQQWYSLDGRRLQGQPTQRGIYIRDGQKVVIR